MRTHETRYGADAIATLTRLVSEAKASDPLYRVTVIVRDEIAALTARRALARGVADRAGVAAVDVTTLRRLADGILARADRSTMPVTAARLTTLWRAALDADPGVLGPVAHHPSTVRALARAHAELRMLGPEALDVVAGSGGLGSDLVRLHRAVVASLVESHADEAQILRDATELLRADPGTVPGGAIVLHLPDEFAALEVELLSALDGIVEMDLVLGAAGDDSVDLALAESLGVASNGPRDVPLATDIVHASDADDEVRAVVRRVVAALADGVRAHRIAVLHAKPLPYARLLHDHLATAGIATNGPGVRPLRDRAIADGFLTLLALDPDDLQRAAFFDWLSRAPAKLGRDVIPRTSWERVSREAGITGGEWDSRLTALADVHRAQLATVRQTDDPSESRVAQHERRIEHAEGLAAFVAEIVDMLAAGRARRTWADLAAWASDAFERCYGGGDALTRLPEDEQRAATAIESTLRGLVELDDVGRKSTIDDLVEILEVELDRARPRVGRFGEGVFVGPISSAASLDVDRTFVLGLSEDMFPGRPAVDPLLPDAVRAAADDLLTSRDRLRTMHRSLLVAFASAPHVTATLARGDLRRGSERLPSRWLMPTLRSLTGKPDLAATKWLTTTSTSIDAVESHWAGIARAEQPGTEQEWRLRQQTSGGPLDEPALDAAVMYAEARASDAFTRFDGNLEGVEGLPDFTDGIRAVSPTALEQYAGCPHAFFMQKVLYVAPIESPDDIVSIRPIDVGNIVHQTMERLAQAHEGALPGFGEAWSTEQRATMRAIAAEVMDEHERRGLTGHPRLWERERAQLLAGLEWLLDADDAARKERNARMVASELRFGFDDLPPVAVEIDGGSVLMRGAADRVDLTRDGTLIVTDFKTGSATGFRDIAKGDDQIVRGTKLQLPLYALAAREAHPADRVEAGYWFVGRRDRGERIDVVLDDALATRYRSALGTLVSGIGAGRFIARPPDVDDFAWVQCAYCNPDAVGYGHVRSASARKRHDPALAELFSLLDPPAPTEEAKP